MTLTDEEQCERVRLAAEKITRQREALEREEAEQARPTMLLVCDLLSEVGDELTRIACDIQRLRSLLRRASEQDSIR